MLRPYGKVAVREYTRSAAYGDGATVLMFARTVCRPAAGVKWRAVANAGVKCAALLRFIYYALQQSGNAMRSEA